MSEGVHDIYSREMGAHIIYSCDMESTAFTDEILSTQYLILRD